MTEHIRLRQGVKGKGGGSRELLSLRGEEHTYLRFTLMFSVLLMILGIAGSTLTTTAAGARNGNDDGAEENGDHEDADTRGGDGGTGEVILVTFSREGIRPGSGTGGTTFLFTVTVTSASEPDETNQPIEVVINQRAHRMKEINEEDTNYQDGKDFYYRDKLDTGGVVYFFRSGNSTTISRSLSVAETRVSNYHYDVAVIMSLFVIPVIIGVWIFRRIEQYSQEMTLALADIAKNLGNGPDGK